MRQNNICDGDITSWMTVVINYYTNTEKVNWPRFHDVFGHGCPLYTVQALLFVGGNFRDYQVNHENNENQHPHHTVCVATEHVGDASLYAKRPTAIQPP